MDEPTCPTPVIQPRDVLAPIATLIGLLTATLGLLVGAALEASLFRIIVNIIVVVILAFVATSVLAIVATWSRRPAIWSFAVGIYAVSWIIFGTGLVFILLAFAYGPDAFRITIPQVQFSADSLTIALTAISAFLASVVYDLTKRGIARLFESISHLRFELPGIDAEVEKQAKEEVSREQDVKMAFVRSTLLLENLVRQAAISQGIQGVDKMSAMTIVERSRSRGLFDLKTSSAFKDVWDLRNKVVHGFDIPDSVTERGLEGAIALSGIFRKILTEKS